MTFLLKKKKKKEHKLPSEKQTAWTRLNLQQAQPTINTNKFKKKFEPVLLLMLSFWICFSVRHFSVTEQTYIIKYTLEQLKKDLMSELSGKKIH